MDRNKQGAISGSSPLMQQLEWSECLHVQAESMKLTNLQKTDKLKLANLGKWSVRICKYRLHSQERLTSVCVSSRMNKISDDWRNCIVVLIRNANSEDSMALGNVYCYAWKEGYKNIIPQPFLDALTVENSAPKPDKINCDNNFVAEDNGNVVGLVNYGQARDKEADNMGELRSIYVLADFWGKGVGRSLFEAASTVLKNRGYDGFYLWVLKENYRARRFYEKMGMVLSDHERTISIAGKKLVESKYEFKFTPISEFTEIRLVCPTMEYDEEIMQFRKEILVAKDSDSFAGCGELRDCATTAEWLKLLKERESVDTCPAGSVTSNTYIAVRTEDNKIVGIIDLRHHINHPILGLWGGHMGYTVRPSERNKGYAKEMLRQNLQKCKDRKMSKVMITCSPDNIASEKTIIANGGVFEKEVYVEGECIKRYWITL